MHIIKVKKKSAGKSEQNNGSLLQKEIENIFRGFIEKCEILRFRE